MKDGTVIDREQRKLESGAFQGFLIVALTFTVFKLYLEYLPVSYLQFTVETRLKLLVPEEGNTTSQPDLRIQAQLVEPICHFSGPTSDFCNMSGDIRIHGSSSTVFVSVTDQPNTLPGYSSYTIRPYTLKGEGLSRIHEFTVKIASQSEQLIPQCTRNHSVAGIVFSIGGYAGNIFHAFSDVLIPLYLTARDFNGEVEFLVTNRHYWWLKKYEAVLKKLSKYDIIDIDTEDGAHCFPTMVVGLKRHKALDINSSISPSHSMADFRKFVREVYSLERLTAIQLREGDERRPRLMILTRKRTRTFTNEGEIVKSARRLGFEVIATEGESHLAQFSRLVHSCDVIVGVHGAGLTNMLFLPKKAVVIQIVPFGAPEWLSRIYFGSPAKKMNLRYLEYRIGLEESSLKQEYPPDHPVLMDPHSIHKQGWRSLQSVYLHRQNVTLDTARFSATLLEAKKLLHL